MVYGWLYGVWVVVWCMSGCMVYGWLYGVWVVVHVFTRPPHFFPH